MIGFAHNMYYVNLEEEKRDFLLFSFCFRIILRNFAETIHQLRKWTIK